MTSDDHEAAPGSDARAASSASAEEAPGRDLIAHSIKRAYDDVASEPLPDRLADLLERLRAGGGPGSAEAGE